MGRADIIDDVARAAGVPLRRPDDDHSGMLYVAPLGPTASLVLHLDETDLLNDEVGMPYSTHPYQVDIRPGTFDRTELENLADTIYQALRSTHRYSMFSTFDTQIVLRYDLSE